MHITEDYYEQINSSNFEKWIREKLLSYFNCLINFINFNNEFIMDNTPYYIV